MRVRFGLRIKFTLLFLGLMSLIGLAVISFLNRSHTSLVREQYMNYAIFIAQMVNGMTDEKELRQYAQSGIRDTHYDELVEQMKEIQLRSEVFYLYVVVVENEEEGIYFFDLKLVDGKSVMNHGLGEKNDLQKNYPGLSEVLSSKNPSILFDKIQIQEEELDSVYVPILNDEGEVTAFAGVDFNQNKFNEETEEYIREAAFSLAGVMAVCFCLLLLIVQFSILHPIFRLERQAELITEGQFQYELEVRGHDELSEISLVFNRMSKSIAGHMEDMRRLNEAYFRYVPAKILTLLGKDNIGDIRLGDEVNAVLTVFSLQLADFDRTIRQKTTGEMIAAMNQVLHCCVPVVAEQEGMVEGFQNAGFTALFDSGCQAAVLSAVTVCQKLNHMVLLKQLEENQAGIGIAFGEVMLGIVGQEKRMAAITASQYRDTACWLQGIARRYQSHILITQTAANQIPDFFETYHIRTLGFLYNTYTGYTDRIYDVYDGDSREEIESKNETREAFEKGVELYCIRDFVGARQKFIEVLKRFTRDRASKEYLYLCDKNIAQGNRQEVDIYFTKVE